MIRPRTPSSVDSLKNICFFRWLIKNKVSINLPLWPQLATLEASPAHAAPPQEGVGLVQLLEISDGYQLLTFSPRFGLDPSYAAFAAGTVVGPRTPTAVDHYSVMIEIRYSALVKEVEEMNRQTISVAIRNFKRVSSTGIPTAGGCWVCASPDSKSNLSHLIAILCL